MAEQVALVLNSGGFQQLQSGDRLQEQVAAVYKTADESITSTTALQDDNHLVFAMAANKKYLFHIHMICSAGAGTGGIKGGVNGPASPTNVAYTTIVWGLSAAATARSTAYDGTAGSTSSGVTLVEIVGTVENGANAGNLVARWAQSSSNANATNVHRGSWMRVQELP